jgi:lycopene cyclase domain-containing protein
MKFLYLIVNLSAVIVPIIFSFHPRIKFYKYWCSFFCAAIIVGAAFTIWDSFFTLQGVWSFNPRYITGIYFFNLPLEEIMFFFCIPFSCVFTYYALNKFYNLSWKNRTENIVCLVLASVLFVTGLLFADRLYTSATFISTAFLLPVLKFIFKIDWFGKMVTVYAILLIPFFIVNGILTGTGLHEPVVLYNNAENLDVRLLTIPVEDVVYGFELILLNVFLYTVFSGRKSGNGS